MKQRIHYLLILLMASLLVVSCVKEKDRSDEPPLGPNDVQIHLPVSGVSTELTSHSKALLPGTPEEDVVNSLQIYLFAGGNWVRTIDVGEDKPNQDINTVWNRGTQTVVLRGLDITKAYAIYAIANHKLTGVTTVDGLMAAFTERSSAQSPPLPTLTQGLVMSGSVANHTFSASNNNKVTIPLTRQVVKMQLMLKMDPAFFAAYPDIVWASNKEVATEPAPLSVAIYNLASRAFIYPNADNRIPNGATPISYGPLSVKSVDGYWPPVTGYIYENYFVDKTFPATYAIINLPYRIGSTIVNHNYYRMQFSQDDGSPFKLKRNRAVQVTATVTGFGLKNPPADNNLLSAIEVKPWADYTVNGDVDNVQLNIATNPVIDFVNGKNGELKFWTNYPSKIYVESTGYLINSTKTETCQVDDYFSDLSGTRSIDTETGIITFSPKDKNLEGRRMQIEVNVGGLKKRINLSFRYVLDIKNIAGSSPTRLSYNGYVGEYPATTNGPGLAEGEASTDQLEPPYAKLEIATTNTAGNNWAAARLLCDIKNNWRAPRIREAAYMYNQRAFFPSRLNFTAMDNQELYSATEHRVDHSLFLWYGFGLSGGWAGAYVKNSTYVFRCVREI
ncbi:MAG: fimbrial protein [Mucinivorans sp.]